MAYTTTAQITTAAGGAVGYVQVFDWDADGIADAAVVAQLQAEAESWIDSYVGKRHAVPLASPTSVLVLHAAEEIVYLARSKRSMATQGHHDAHERRVKWLEDVAKGLVVVSDPPPAPATTVRSGWVSRDADDVSREGLKGGW